VPYALLQHLHALSWDLRSLLGNGHCPIHQLLKGNDLADNAHLPHLLRSVILALQVPLHGLVSGEFPNLNRNFRQISQQHLWVAKGGIIGRHNQITHQGDHVSTADTVSLHRADNRFGQIPQILEEFDFRPCILSALGNVGNVILHALLQVKAGGERLLTGTSDHNGSDALVVIGHMEILRHQVYHFCIQCISFFCTIERDDCDRIVHLVQNQAHVKHLLCSLAVIKIHPPIFC